MDKDLIWTVQSDQPETNTTVIDQVIGSCTYFNRRIEILFFGLFRD